MKDIRGGVVAPAGFRAAGVSAGLKTKADSLDVGLIVSDVPATVAGCFTRNRVFAAPVRWSRGVARRGRARAILVNSGNANACTGERGLADVRACADQTAALLAIEPNDILVASTGIIGHPLPMAKMRRGIRLAADSLGRSAKHASAITRAIMTTDTAPKSCAVETRLPRGKVRIGGVAKGAGMISPMLGTMLSFVTTDASVSPPLLRRVLREVVDRTYNRLTVDGDTSTNDTVALLANGASGARIHGPGKALDAFTAGLESVMRRLVEALARDGEGATRLIVVTVRGARRAADADKVARAIANSPLVKCAVHGGDPNWGRIICAAGYSGAPVEPELMELRIGGVCVFRSGLPVKARAASLKKAMSGKETLIVLDLNQGGSSATMWTCDYSREYIAINAEYHT